jgi:ABC-type polysaccharide/polyol phosphate export permease
VLVRHLDLRNVRPDRASVLPARAVSTTDMAACLAPASPSGPPEAVHTIARVGVYAEVLRQRELFASLFRRDLRAKYKGSVLGLAWTLALPVALMLVYLVVFSVLWRAEATDLDDYWLFLLCGLPPWAFFAASLQTGARSLVENAPLIRKVRFPRQLVPLSVVATQVVAFAATTAIVLVLSLWFRPESRDVAWVAVPVAAVIVMFVAGLALAVASLNAIFRDVEFVVAAALLPWFFLTPVLYQLDDLPGADSRPWLIDLLHWGNPLTPAVESYRTPLYAGELPSAGDALYLCIAALIALFLGALVFSSVDDRIASEA